MNLSDAIRSGSKMLPQHFGSLWKLHPRGHSYLHESSCALGAAWDSSGQIIPTEPNGYNELEAIFPVLKQEVSHPVHKELVKSLRNVIIGLNDHQRWSREAIAEWVEVQERKLGMYKEVKSEADHGNAELAATSSESGTTGRDENFLAKPQHSRTESARLPVVASA